jgi:cardiolipin synthase
MTFTEDQTRTRRETRPPAFASVSPSIRHPSSGTSPGINIAPGRDDDGGIVPRPFPLADGSTVQLYKDGEALYAAYHAIESAHDSVGLEVYIFHSDDTGYAFAELLSRKARQGVDVRVIYDAVGSIDTKRAMFDAMRNAGVKLREFHPVLFRRGRTGWRPFNRDHRKLVVIDNETAVLGGQNLGNEYGSSWVVGKSDEQAWRDTAVGVNGPAARLLSEAYARMWNFIERGGPIGRAEFFQSQQSRRDDPGGSMFDNQPSGRISQPQRLSGTKSILDVPEDSLAVLASVPTPRSKLLPSLQTLLRDATSSIEMTMAYFAPPAELLQQLCRSAQQGVRVRLMFPGRSDVALLRIAARAFYEKLMAAGVEIFERQYAVLHAKTLCVDGRLSIVGSTNLDYRSIQFNCELATVIHSKCFGAQMHRLFNHDVCHACRILPDEWRHRPLRDRLIQWTVTRARYLL